MHRWTPAPTTPRLASISPTPGLHNIHIATCNPFVVRYCQFQQLPHRHGLKSAGLRRHAHREQHPDQVQHLYNNCTTTTISGITVYDENPVTAQNNACNNNKKSGINIFRSTSGGKLPNNTAPCKVANLAYDIWLNGCANMTISGNTHST
jgi:parallel beta-helix repeat protein